MAYHEAGHAIVACFYQIPFDYVSIDKTELPKDQAGGVITVNPKKAHKAIKNTSKYEALHDITRELLITLAGPVADSIATNSDCQFKVMDIPDLDSLILLLAALQMNEQETTDIICRLREQIEELFRDKEIWGCVQVVAGVLLKRKRLNYEEVVSILKKQVS